MTKRDKEIAGLHSILLERKKGLLKSLNAGYFLEDNSSLKTDDDTIAQGEAQDFVNHAIVGTANQELASINEALERFESKSYGVCDMCEKDIIIERLKALPFALRCAKCQEQYERTHHDEE